MLTKVSDYTPVCDPPDMYDKDIQYLLGQLEINDGSFREAVHIAWSNGGWHEKDVPRKEGSSLFRYACRCVDQPDWEYSIADPHNKHGCLTQVHVEYNGCSAISEELTRRIREDDRLPHTFIDILPDHIPIFAEYQRLVDKEYYKPVVVEDTPKPTSVDT